MFTGIIEQSGIIKGKTGNRINIFSNYADLKNGESIAINGVCLTVEKVESKVFTVFLSDETRKKTNLYKLNVGEKVNLERALCLGDRISGHLMTGHIDGLGKIKRIIKKVQTYLLEIDYPLELSPYILKKGSIGVEGISLTVIQIKGKIFQVEIIPYTWENTNLKYKKSGDTLNLEVDILCRYLK